MSEPYQVVHRSRAARQQRRIFFWQDQRGKNRDLAMEQRAAAEKIVPRHTRYYPTRAEKRANVRRMNELAASAGFVKVVKVNIRIHILPEQDAL